MLVSVVTVCLNSARFLEAAITTLLVQTYQNFEWIVVDGGSTDGTLAVLERYRDRIAVLISEPDHGIYHAMNKGLLHARGELVYFLNADDALYDEGVLAGAISAFERFPAADVIYGNAELIYQDGTKKLAQYPNLLFWEHFRDRTLCHQSVFTRRSAFATVGVFDTSYRLAADYAWILKSIWQHDLSYQYLPATICRFAMGGSHQSPANSDLLQRERSRAVMDYVADYDFIGSNQRRKLTLRTLLLGDPDFPFPLQALRRGEYRKFFVDFGVYLRQAKRLRWFAFRLCLHRAARRISSLGSPPAR